MILQRTSFLCFLHVSGTSLGQVEEHFEVIFPREGNQKARIASVGTVMHQLQRSTLKRRGIGEKANNSIFISGPMSFSSIIRNSNDRKYTIANTTVEIRFFRRISGITLFDWVLSLEIKGSLHVEPPHLRIDRAQLQYYGHVIRISQERFARRILKAKQTGRRSRSRPKTGWQDN